MQSKLPVPDRTFNITWAVRIMLVVLAALAAVGAYARYWLGKGH
jgi:hypothetical protein